MDAVLDMDLVDVLKEINLRDETREALLGGQNSLREIFDLALLYERGYWDQVTPAAQKLSIDPSCLSPQYFDAVNWAEETFLMH
jgi:c-di-GMP-related signal transduction protein